MQKQELHDVYLSLGSNLGNKEENIIQAIRKINERIGAVVAYSAFYITEPVGFQSDNLFVNAACIVLSSLSPLALLEETKKIEIEMGRSVKSKDQQYADRIIDIDVIFYDEAILEEEELVLPHPRMHQRSFVLDPLAELAGDYIHPILRKTLAELKDELDKKGQ